MRRKKYDRKLSQRAKKDQNNNPTGKVDRNAYTKKSATRKENKGSWENNLEYEPQKQYNTEKLSQRTQNEQKNY